MSDVLPPEAPLTKAALLEVFRRTVPSEYHDPIAAHESYAMFRAMAAAMAVVADKGLRTAQARFHLASSLQRDAPASGPVPASGDVVLQRAGPSTEALVLEAGELRLQALGRTYANATRLVWNPGDTGTRTVAFACEVPGFVGNLGHLATAGGLLPLEHVALADQARDRTGVGGSILTGAQTIVQDTGLPDVFAPEDVGLYLRIANSAASANVGAVRKVVGFAWPEEELPAGSGRYPRQVLLEDAVRRNATEVQEDNGGVFTDRWAAARSETAGDVPLLPTPLTVGDALYFGHTAPFTSVIATISTPGAGTWTVTWEYWNGAAWTALTVDDPSSGWRPAAAGDVEVSYAAPANWVTRTSPAGSGLTLYFARARLSAHTSTTTAPVASRIVLKVPEPLAADSGSVTWQLHDGEDLGLEIVSAEAFADGRDDDLWILGDERGIYRAPGEDDASFRQRVARLGDAVAPNAILRVVNRALAPYGYRGQAIDVDNGMTGLFLDVPADQAPDSVGALDLYGAGDPYPQDPWILLLDHGEAFGWFAVLVPYLGAGEFGQFCDDGPLYSEGAGWNGPAVDSAFMDGYPVAAYALYGAIYSQVAGIKLGGVRFSLIRDATLGADSC